MTTIFTAVTAVIFLGICYYAGESDVDEQSTALEQETTTATTAKLSTTTATTTADETANQKTYTNDEYGFSFKYPAAWTLEEGASSAYPRRIVSVKSNEPNENKIWPSPPKNYYYDQVLVYKEIESTPAEWIKSRLAGGYTDNSKTVTINGTQYTEIVPGSDPEYLAELKVDNGQLLSIIFDWASSRTDITATQEKILSTFQFTK